MLKTFEIQEAPVAHKKECRFYLFVRWKKGARSFGPPTSTYNGNKHVADGDPGKEIINLIKIFMKENHNMAVALLYDNSVPKYQEERDILKWCNGVIEINRIWCYQSIIHDFPIPALLK